MRRVVITGAGIISPLGSDIAGFADALFAGRSGIAPLTLIDTSQLRFTNGAEVPNYQAETYFDARDISLMERFSQFAIIAAREATAQAGIEWTQELREETAIITGSCLGGRNVEEAGYWELFHNGKSRIHPLTIPLSMTNAATSHISMAFHVEGPSYTISTACSSSAHAIGQAFQLVRSGGAPMAITGGSEAPFFLGGRRIIKKDGVGRGGACGP